RCNDDNGFRIQQFESRAIRRAPARNELPLSHLWQGAALREINSADPTGESHANEMGEALRLHLANLATLGQAESVIVARRMSLKIKQRKPIVDAQSQLFELG
ncbi:hypothetical protein, partial [Sinorhizobium medicae]|uniref:hypothetical protein n=1 Tax=Sinorhizobium medicae TaxID=110321 RepID=UPI001AECFB03